ncbi:hypothetical protein GCM10010276_66940 [Streptomyces longisporus]|uniref:Uncharacterized protein n=1 Tax=Streptomyces longisporus TaxID=1948 RepID=A0ABN3MXQ3_STRLO
MPATRVPAGRDLRCDAKGGDSFHAPPTELAVGFGRVVRKGCPTVRAPKGRRTDHPKVGVGPRLRMRGGAPDSAEAARPGDVRRWGSCGLPER